MKCFLRYKQSSYVKVDYEAFVFCIKVHHMSLTRGMEKSNRLDLLIEAEWRIYMSVDKPYIGSHDGLSPGRRQATI